MNCASSKSTDDKAARRKGSLPKDPGTSKIGDDDEVNDRKGALTKDSDAEESDRDMIENGENAVQFGLEVATDEEVTVGGPYSGLVSSSAIREAGIGVVEEVGEIEVSEELFMQYLRRHNHKALKTVLRTSVWPMDHDIRRLLWKQMCKYLHKMDDHDIFEEFAQDLFGDSTDDIRLAAFVDPAHVSDHCLTEEGIVCVKKIVSVVEHACPDIMFCPMLFPLVSVFLHYMDASECYNCIYQLLGKKSDYIPQTKVAYEASKLVMRDLSKKYAKSGYVYIVRNSGSVDAVFASWIWWILEDLPFSYLVRVIDCYILEGIKVFYRVAMAILILYSKYGIKKSSSPKQDASNSNILGSIRQFCQEIPVKVDKLLKVGFSIRGLTRREIRKLQAKHEMYVTSVKNISTLHEMKNRDSVMKMSRSFSGPIVLPNLGSNTLTQDMPTSGVERCRSKSIAILPAHPPWVAKTPGILAKTTILDKHTLFSIWTWLPTRYAVCQPELLYTSEEHGTSLGTLYQRVENHQPTVIVIKTTDDEIFGAFCSTYWRDRRARTKNLSYFGTGETFLFTLLPEKKKYEWVGLLEENIPNTANMFQAGDRSVLTIGGGHGEAIFLDENLLHCRTERCDTFGNEPLTQLEDFQCKVVEVYGFK